MGFFRRRTEQTTSIEREVSRELDPQLAPFVGSDDTELRKAVLRDQAAIIEKLRPEDRIVFLGRALNSSGDRSIPPGSTIIHHDGRFSGRSRRED